MVANSVNLKKYAEGFNHVGDILSEVVKGDRDVLNLESHDVELASGGAVACLAGFYALRTVGLRQLRQKHEQYDHAAALYPTMFMVCSDMFASDIGFDSVTDMLEFAQSNPDIWGNELGWGMLSSSAAYGKEAGALTLSDAALWFKQVAWRCRKAAGGYGLPEAA